MPTPNNDALSVDTRSALHSACPDVERIDTEEWPTLGQDRTPSMQRLISPSLSAPVSLDSPSVSIPNVSADKASSHDEMDGKPDVDGPDPRTTEQKGSIRSAIDHLETMYRSRDPNPSPAAYPYLLPPPPRSLHTSSFLRSGSRFIGKQQSDKQVYKVEVTLKSVDIKESLICGFLRIEGLTKDHPTLTTCFEGEIIGSKYSFRTRHESWGASEKIDMQHWARFPAWRPLASQAKRADFRYKNYMEKENIFMRWKEYFLVPDHRVREIHGASFEGFYYICFNQVKGTVSGIYFHYKSEKFQQLDLDFVPDGGGFAAVEFR